MTSAAPVVVTMGEPAGIGGDVTLQAWAYHRDRLPPFFIIDDPGRISALALALRLDCSLQTISDASEAHIFFPKSLPIMPVNPPLANPVTPGSPLVENAPSVIGAIDQAVSHVLEGNASALVTNPIHKATLQNAGFSYPGHTEYLNQFSVPESQAVMMLVGGGLRVVPVTSHMSIHEAVATLSTEAIIAHGRVTASALFSDFKIEKPRLAVAALNPHAGEDGKFGSEEAKIISPAVKALQSHGLDVVGPLPADTLFHQGARKEYDAVLCMYHDQALIPLKTLDFYGGVNLTLGLPFVRTSPDHGTAFNIAGGGAARCDSLVSAICLASEIVSHRRIV